LGHNSPKRRRGNAKIISGGGRRNHVWLTSPAGAHEKYGLYFKGRYVMLVQIIHRHEVAEAD
jgi:hypothetical protein